MTSPFALVLAAVSLAVSATGSLLLSRIGKNPDLHKALLFLRFDELHRLHIRTMMATWAVLLGYVAASVLQGPPPLFPHGLMMGLMSVWSLFMAVSMTLLVRGPKTLLSGR